MSEKCYACGNVYDTVYSVPDEVWAKISPVPVDGFKSGGLLCLDCADSRADTLGLYLFWSAGIHVYPEARIKELEAERAAGLIAMDFAKGAIHDAIATEDGLDGEAGSAVMSIITEWQEHGAFDKTKCGELTSMERVAATAIDEDAYYEIESLKKKLAAAQARIAELDANLSAGFQREVELTHKLAEANQSRAESVERHKDTKRHLGVAQARIAELEARCAKAEADSTRLDKLQESFIKGEEFHIVMCEGKNEDEDCEHDTHPHFEAFDWSWRSSPVRSGTLRGVIDKALTEGGGHG